MAVSGDGEEDLGCIETVIDGFSLLNIDRKVKTYMYEA